MEGLTPTEHSSVTIQNESEKNQEITRAIRQNQMIQDLKKEFESKCEMAKEKLFKKIKKNESPNNATQTPNLESPVKK